MGGLCLVEFLDLKNMWKSTLLFFLEEMSQTVVNYFFFFLRPITGLSLD